MVCHGCGWMGEAGTQRCPDCGMSLDPNAVVGSSRVHVKQLDGGVIVELPWMRDLNGLGFLVSAGMALVPLYLLITDFMYSWPLALLLAPVTYGMAATVLNRTTVIVARGGVDISHGPLPTLSKAVTLTPEEARNLRLLRRETHSRRGGTMVTYDLAGPHGSITTYWNHSDGLDSALSVVERVLSFQRAPMGSVPMGYGFDNPLVPMGLAGVFIIVMLGFRPSGYGVHERIVTDLFHLPDDVEFSGFRSGRNRGGGEYVEAVVQFTPEQWSRYTPGFGFDTASFQGYDLGRTPVEARPSAEALRWRDRDDAVIDYQRNVAIRWADWGWLHSNIDDGKPRLYDVEHRRSFCFGVEGEGAEQRIEPCTAFEHRPTHYTRALLDEDDHRLFVVMR